MRSTMLAICTALALAGAAQAHAFLDRADPRVGAVIRQAPRSLRLWFTQRLVAPFCQVTVTGPAGFGGAGPSHAAPGDPQSLVVDLRGPTPPGRYTVRWRVVSVDTHMTQGDFAFTVRP